MLVKFRSNVPHTLKIFQPIFFLLLFFNPYLRIFFHCFLEREEGKERGTSMWERNIVWLPNPVCTPTGDGTCNPGLCPDQESNRLFITLQDDVHMTEPHGSVMQHTFTWSFLSAFVHLQTVVAANGLVRIWDWYFQSTSFFLWLSLVQTRCAIRFILKSVILKTGCTLFLFLFFICF